MNSILTNRGRKNYFDLHPHNRNQNKKRLESYFEQINSLLKDSGNLFFHLIFLFLTY